MAKKTVVLATRINEQINEALKGIADRYDITLSHLINSVLICFVNEYSKNLIENFSIVDENTEND